MIKWPTTDVCNNFIKIDIHVLNIQNSKDLSPIIQHISGIFDIIIIWHIHFLTMLHAWLIMQWPPLVISKSGILTLCEWTCSSPPRTSGVVSPWYWTQSWTRCLQCVAECSPLACYVPVYQIEHLIIYNIRFISIIILSMFLTPSFSKLLNRICYVFRIMKDRKKRYAGINSVLNFITLLLLWIICT